MTILERIQANVVVDPATGCWLWQRSVTAVGGYARLRVGGKDARAHRALWIELHGPLGPHELVCHRCDVPRCCNPGHLFVGSYADNHADMTAKGRRARGEMLPHAKLTAELVRAIRADPRSQRQVAADFGVNRSCVSLIKSRVNWAHVPMEDNP